jgi:hypothetical protein
MLFSKSSSMILGALVVAAGLLTLSVGVGGRGALSAGSISNR